MVDQDVLLTKTVMQKTGLQTTSPLISIMSEARMSNTIAVFFEDVRQIPMQTMTCPLQYTLVVYPNS